LAAFKEKDLWGFINTQGKVVVKPIYNEVTNFKDGKAIVKVKNLSGVIDTQGKYVIGLRAGYIGNFNDGLAIFCAKGKPNSDVYPVGYIDEKGKIVIPIQYYDVSDFSSGLATVRIKSAPYGLVYIDKKGKIVIKDDDFENTTSFYGDVAFVEKDDKWAMIDKKGKYIKEPTFKHLEAITKISKTDEVKAAQAAYINYVVKADEAIEKRDLLKLKAVEALMVRVQNTKATAKNL